MFKTILRNLIANAIKYTHLGGKIKIIVEKDTKNIEELEHLLLLMR